MPVSAAKFIEQLSSVSLLASAEVDTLRDQLKPEQLQADAEQLAKELVKNGKLTKFQAAALYQGKGKGLVFGEYVVLDKLGAGGMGQVFKAHHRRMKRLAAVKVLSPHIIKDAQAVQRFYQEVEMAAKLAHQNIVAAYDAAEANGLHYLVMEYVEGRDLSSLLQKQGPLSLEQVMNCIRQAAEGLAYAHAQGVVHRDIKPGNLLVDKSGTVKILDMGLARTVDALEQQDKSSKQELTQAGQVMGTVDYMAPEQARDARTADHRADIYSLGCTMYRLLTGYVPYPADTMVKKLMAHAHQPIPSLKKHCPQASPQLEELFRRMLEKDPAKRIGSAKEVATVLADLLGAAGDRPSVSVLDDGAQGDEGQSFLKASASSVSKLGKGKGSTISKVSTSGIGKVETSGIGKVETSGIGKHKQSAAKAVAEPTRNKNRVVYGSAAAAAVLLLVLVGWLATRGDAESEPVPAGAVAAAPPPTKPIVSLPHTTAAKLVAPNPSATTPGATSAAITSSHPIAFNAPTPMFGPAPIPTSTAPLPSVPAGGAVDLMSQIQLGRDVIVGKWTLTAGRLRAEIDPSLTDTFKTLRIYENVPPRYALSLVAKRLSGYTGLILNLPMGAGYGVMVIDRSGVSGIGGLDADKLDSSNETTVMGDAAPKLLIDKPVELRIMVTDDRVTATADGRPFIDWQGSFERMVAKRPKWSQRGTTAAVGVGVDAEFEFTKLELTPLESSAAATVASSSPASTTPTVASPAATPTPAAPIATAAATASTVATIAPPEPGENFALSFDGSTSLVRVPRLFLPADHIVTVEMTIWPSDAAYANGNPTIIGNLQEGGMALKVNSEGVFLAVRRSMNGQTAEHRLEPRKPPIKSNQRYRVAAVLDAAEWRLFSDGKLVGRQPAVGEPITANRSFLIGADAKRSPPGWELPYRGILDELRVSATARYRENYTPQDRLETDEHTLALFHFDEGSGDVLRDSSGRGNVGKIEGAQWLKAPTGDLRIAPPDSSTRLRVLADLDRELLPDLQKIKTPTDRALLARRLLAEAGLADKPTHDRFARAQRALELAVESGDRALLDEALIAHERDFQGSVDARLTEALGVASKKLLPTPVMQTVARTALDGWQRAYGDDRLEEARMLADAALLSTRKANDPALTKWSGDVAKRMNLGKAIFDAAIAAQQKLDADANDAAAHLALGQYLCFDKEDWFAGLEHLTMGSDAALAALASQSLAAQRDPAKQLTTGDAWYDTSVKATGKAKMQYQSAAVFWYLEAYNRLSGAERARVETRLNQLNAKSRPLSFTQARREREAAVAVINLSGTLSVVVPGDSQVRPVSALEDLPVEPFWVNAVTIASKDNTRHPLTSSVCEKLSELKSIADLEVIRYLPRKDCYALLARLTTLQSLTMIYADVKDEDLIELLPLTNLRVLKIVGNNTMTDQAGDVVNKLPRLTDVDLDSVFSDALIGKLATLNELTKLHVNSPNLTDATLATAARMRKLTTLILSGGSKLSPPAVAQFRTAVPQCKLLLPKPPPK